MKILITGTQGLAQELGVVYQGHDITNVSRNTGHDIMQIHTWGPDFLNHDLVLNCAYSGLGQALVLDFFYRHWFNRPEKTIVTIGSKVIHQPRIEQERDHEYWAYREHKKILQHMHNQLWPTAMCDLKIVNPGAFDSAMVAELDVPKMSLFELAQRIQTFAKDPINKRLDLWL